MAEIRGFPSVLASPLRTGTTRAARAHTKTAPDDRTRELQALITDLDWASASLIRHVRHVVQALRAKHATSAGRR